MISLGLHCAQLLIYLNSNMLVRFKTPQHSLVGGLEHFFIFPYIGFLVIPIDFHIFQRSGPTTKQQQHCTLAKYCELGCPQMLGPAPCSMNQEAGREARSTKDPGRARVRWHVSTVYIMYMYNIYIYILCIHIHIYVYTYIYIHTYIHTHRYMHMYIIQLYHMS